MTAMLFEGTEKKLAIIMPEPRPDLRSNSDGRWNAVVHACGAEILSVRKSRGLDAYLLSESSLFVWDDRILMITCGRTQLVNSLPVLIEIVGMDNVALVHYERKNLMYPELQVSDFETEIGELTGVFPGKSYRLGPANEDHIHIFYSSIINRTAQDDICLEMLMHELHPDVLAAFLTRRYASLSETEEAIGISRIYPDMKFDSYRFQPYGYSINKISGRYYVAIHVTPEKNGSFASFETNVPEPDYGAVINSLLDIFRPKRFSMVMTEAGKNHRYRNLPRTLPGYSRTEKTSCEFDCGYFTCFSSFVRDTGSIRLGKQ